MFGGDVEIVREAVAGRDTVSIGLVGPQWIAIDREERGGGVLDKRTKGRKTYR